MRMSRGGALLRVSVGFKDCEKVGDKDCSPGTEVLTGSKEVERMESVSGWLLARKPKVSRGPNTSSGWKPG
jgi:hypothetical protein